MKTIFILFLSSVLAVAGCTFTKTMADQPKGEHTASTKLQKKTETFTGKVVFADGAYRFALIEDPKTLLRLTRARQESIRL
jgi:hypothetical protein